jgi:hypothetical protein
MITVYCEDHSHAQRRWEIARFEKVPASPDAWALQPSVGNGRLRRSEDIVAALDGDTYLTRPQAIDQLESARDQIRPNQPVGDRRPIRLRYNLSCEVCNRTVPCRAHRLYRVLNTLAGAGVEEISLKGLAAIR